MLAHVTTGTVHGIQPVTIRVEVNLAFGLPSFTVVGLPYGAVRESRERVAAALRNSGFQVPSRRITVNLAPADVRKEGTALDLPLALGLLAANGSILPESLAGVGFLGELGLDGSLRAVPGVLPLATHLAARSEAEALVVPAGNGPEAALVDGLSVVAPATLTEVVDHLSGRRRLEPVRVDGAALLKRADISGADLADVRGQAAAKRGLEIAAAGGHNILLIGPPGSGKTMLAMRLAGILPDMSIEEALACTSVHSVAGVLPPGSPLVTRRPFRAPHHTVSEAGLAGGGRPVRPGEISLAHHGVLFLDELPEFRRSALELLRQPLEEGSVRISRASGTLEFPSRFLLAAAMNPCPCGYLGDGTDRCLCDPPSVARYQGRASGPLRDRIDLGVQVPALSADALRGSSHGETSATVRARVQSARMLQLRRFVEVHDVHSNADMHPSHVSRWCRGDAEVERLISAAVARMGLSARGYHRVLRVARTIADLEGAPDVRVEHAAEALQFRGATGSNALRSARR